MGNHSNTDGLSELLCGFIGFLLGSVLVGSIGIGIVNSSWKANTIKRGYAEYNSQTGNWQWKELKPESEANDE